MRPETVETTEPAHDIGAARPKGRFGSWRAVAIGTALVPVNVWFLFYMECAHNAGPGTGAGPYPSTVSLFANAVCFLLVLTGLNALYRRIYSRPALDRGELLVIYVMLTISTSIVSIDFLDILVPMLTYPFRYATPENNWAQILWPHIPHWLAVSDPVAVKGWYEGHTTLYTWEHIRPWLPPVTVWSGVMLVMVFVMFCMNTIVRQQWTQHDRLQFPLVEVPLQITEPGGRLLRSRLMWIGFSIAFGISLWNGLAYLYPSMPPLSVKMWDISPLFVGRPWNVIGWTPISFYPYAIGLGFLLPVDMLFSCWFFYVMWRVVRIVGAVYGVYDVPTQFPYMDQQALGAYYFIGIFAIWSGRRHLATVLRRVFGDLEDPGETDAPMTYRTAVFGLVIGTLAIMAFFMFVGLRWWVAVVAISLYFLIALAIARMHAEFGPPMHDMHYMGPEIVLTQALGTTAFGPGELAGLSWFWWFNRAYRSIPIAYQLDGMKLAERARTSQRQIAVGIGIASVVAVVCGFWVYLYYGYQRGAEVGMANHVTWFGTEAWQQHFGNWTVTPAKPDLAATSAIAWGMLITYLLYFMKLRLDWWPFHPLGFAVSTSYAIGTLWLPLAIAWAAKLITLRVGGLKAYRVVLDFFLGLVLGDFVMGCLWPLIGWVVGISTYSYMQ